MPFPLAHPAAVLPLRRFSPRWLSLPALIAGSISPDFSYFFARWGMDEFAHEPLRGFLFSVPMGLVLLGGVVLAVKSARVWFPVWFGQALARAGHLDADIARSLRLGGLCRITVSVLLGAATHVLWDSFTHKTGWLARETPFLQQGLLALFGHKLRPYHVLWYLSSFGGAACMAYAWERWREQLLGFPKPSLSRRLLRAFLLGSLVVPIAAAHHLIAPPLGNLAAGALTLLLLLGLVASLRTARPPEVAVTT